MSLSNDVTLMFDWIHMAWAAACGTNRTRQVFDVWAARSPSRPAFHLKFNSCGWFCPFIGLRVNSGGDGVFVCACVEWLCSVFTLCYGMQSVAIGESTIHLSSLCGWGGLAVKLSLAESQMEVMRGEFLFYCAL